MIRTAPPPTQAQLKRVALELVSRASTPCARESRGTMSTFPVRVDNATTEAVAIRPEQRDVPTAVETRRRLG